MAITSSDVLNLAPELSSTPADRVAWAVEQANARLNNGVLGQSRADLARTYYAAHLLSLESTSGMVTSESAGGISRSYRQADNPLELTPYGREYQRIIRSHAGRIGVIG